MAAAPTVGADELARGRGARSPREIPRRGWWDILRHTRAEVGRDNVSLVAAGVAFYALLAVFPAIAAVVSIYGLVADPGSAARFLANAPSVPGEVRDVLSEQARRVAGTSSSALGLGLAGALLLTIYGASKAVSALITALNIAYQEREERGFLRLTLLSVGLTAGGLLFGALALGLIVGVPAAVALADPPTWIAALAHALVWPILGAGAIAGLALLYRVGPDRAPADWPWVRFGAIVATVLWLIGSAGFTIYVANFGSYNETYGSVGAIVVVLMWFWLSAYVIILGAELNAEIEHQTRVDSSVGPDEEMGSRASSGPSSLTPADAPRR